MFFRPFQCKDCESVAGFRSRPRTLTEKYLLPVLLLRPVRCGDCFRRTYQSIFVEVREREPGLPHRAAA
jgi:hypothetical protein